MHARARIVAERDGRGGTRPAVLRSESPLLLRRTFDPTALTVHLVGGAAGPLRGDDLRLDIEVGPGAHLTVHSVAAQLALPGRAGLPASRFEIHASVAAGGTLIWAPEPLIAAAGCDHRAVTVVDVAEGGCLHWRDDLVCGRHGEPAGDVTTELTVRYGGRTAYRHDLAVGPRAPAWSGAAVLGGAQAFGTVVLLGVSPRAQALEGEAALMSLAGSGAVAAAAGADIRDVRRALDPLLPEVPAVGILGGG